MVGETLCFFGSHLRNVNLNPRVQTFGPLRPSVGIGSPVQAPSEGDCPLWEVGFNSSH